MTKPVIVTRAGKGAPLTRAELDANFSNIDDATIGISDGTNSGSLSLNDTLNFAASGNATVAYNSGTKTITVGASGGGGGGSNIVVLSTGNIHMPTDDSQGTGGIMLNTWNLVSNGGISGVSVSGTNGVFTLPAGTYLFEMCRFSNNQSYNGIHFRDKTNSLVVANFDNVYGFNFGAGTRYYHEGGRWRYTVSGSTQFTFANGNSGQNSDLYLNGQNPSSLSMDNDAVNQTIIFKIYKIS